MRLKDVLKEAISKLPDYLRNDIDFISILKSLYAFLENILEEECYLVLNKERYDDEFFRNSGQVKSFVNTNIVISLSYQSENDIFFSFAIYDLNEFGFAIDLNRSDYDKMSKSSYISLIKSKKGSNLKVENSSYNDTEYFDYNIFLMFYDSFHKRDKSKDIETKKDEIFVDKFYVPVEDARLLRLNFRRFREKINEYRLAGLRKTNQEMEKTMGYLFSSPFRLGDLETFIQNNFGESFDNNDEETIYQVSEDGEEDFENFDPEQETEDLSELDMDSDKLSMVLNVLANYMDIDSQIIVSDTILNDLIDYASDEMAQSLNTTGIIIKRDGNEFIVYYIAVTNNNFIIVPAVKPLEEIKENYLKNPLNESVRGLEEFFEINPKR